MNLQTAIDLKNASTLQNLNCSLVDFCISLLLGYDQVCNSDATSGRWYEQNCTIFLGYLMIIKVKFY